MITHTAGPSFWWASRNYTIICYDQQVKTNFGTSGPCLTSNVTWAPVTATVYCCPNYDISPGLCPLGSLLCPFQPPHSGRLRVERQLFTSQAGIRACLRLVVLLGSPFNVLQLCSSPHWAPGMGSRPILYFPRRRWRAVSSAKWIVHINVKYAKNGLLHIWHINLHISAYFLCIFFAYLTI